MKNWKLVVFILVIIIVAIGVPLGINFLVGYIAATKNTEETKYYEVIDYSNTQNYLGTIDVSSDGKQYKKYDVLEALGLDNSYSLTCNVNNILQGTMIDFRSISDDILDECVITITGHDDTKTYKIVNGYNIHKAENFLQVYSGDFSNGAVYINENVVLMSDIVMKDIYNTYKLMSKKYLSIRISKSMFGNGHEICLSGMNSSETLEHFIFSGSGATLSDVRFLGKVFVPNEKLLLEDLYYCGILASFRNESGEKVSIDIVNCLFQNGFRNVQITNGDVSFTGCLFNNSAETNMSVKTTMKGASNIKLMNCIFANSCSASITNWSRESVDTSCYCTFEFSGFVDFYSWHKQKSVKIVSSVDDNADFYNTLMQTYISKYDNLYKYNGEKYFSSAIYVVGFNGDINATFKGLEEQGLSKIDLLQNTISLVDSLDVYSYMDSKKITPDATLGDNIYLYYQMRYGR